MSRGAFLYDDVSGRVLPKDEVIALRSRRKAERRMDSQPSTRKVERGVWRVDRKTGELLPLAEWHRRNGDTTTIGMQIIKDIDPYRAVGLPGSPIIGGRKQHKDAMRAHGMVEVGNEKVEKKYEEAPGLRDDIKRALYDVHRDL